MYFIRKVIQIIRFINFLNYTFYIMYTKYIESHWPGRKRTMAFMQANSAGSTMTALYLCRVSCKCLTSAATWLGLPVVVCRCNPECGCECGERVRAVSSAALKRGDDSSGRHHWTALRRNSSDQTSSSNIT